MIELRTFGITIHQKKGFVVSITPLIPLLRFLFEGGVFQSVYRIRPDGGEVRPSDRVIAKVSPLGMQFGTATAAYLVEEEIRPTLVSAERVEIFARLFREEIFRAHPQIAHPKAPIAVRRDWSIVLTKLFVGSMLFPDETCLSRQILVRIQHSVLFPRPQVPSCHTELQKGETAIGVLKGGVVKMLDTLYQELACERHCLGGPHVSVSYERDLLDEKLQLVRFLCGALLREEVPQSRGYEHVKIRSGWQVAVAGRKIRNKCALY